MTGKVEYWWCMLGLKYPPVQYFKKSNLQPNEIYLWMKTNGASLTLNIQWAFQSIHFLKEFFFFGRPFSKSFLNLLQYCFCFMFWFHGCEPCGILVPWPGIELGSTGRWSRHHWSTRQVPFHPFLPALYCTDIPNILWLWFFFFFFNAPLTADKDGFLFSSFCAYVYKSWEGRGTEWRLNGCKLAEHSL